MDGEGERGGEESSRPAPGRPPCPRTAGLVATLTEGTELTALREVAEQLLPEALSEPPPHPLDAPGCLLDAPVRIDVPLAGGAPGDEPPSARHRRPALRALPLGPLDDVRGHRHVLVPPLRS
ncbi:hypothetical protein [Streptomyces narbonensis]|uniref:hypothetical protein n=1 Tax=Streptomyces narbonensis TaxID=67333 RepID=UPI001E435351|nr:hypothetical protein [Streptomyces narbonensis]